jgi:hypothetical protein
MPEPLQIDIFCDVFEPWRVIPHRIALGENPWNRFSRYLDTVWKSSTQRSCVMHGLARVA